MRRIIATLIFGAALLAACVDQPTGPALPQLASKDTYATDVLATRHPLHAAPLQYRVTGDFVSSQSSWDFLFARMIITGLDAWVDRQGNMGGSYEVQVDWTGGGEPLVSHEEVVCVSVDPSTRQAWIVSARPDPTLGTHYSILQMKDLSPASMSTNGREHSGRYDLYAGRSIVPWEAGAGPEFCLLQPDLSQIPVEIPGVGTYPAVQMFPIDEGGDIDVQIRGP